MQNRVKQLLGIAHPIVQGGMQWVGRAGLAAAVSEAGALGMLSALTQATPTGLSREIEACRALTARPFGVNLTVMPKLDAPPYDAYVQAIIDGDVRVVETSGNVPAAMFERLKSAGIVVIHKCTSVRHALSAQRHGVDIISMDGHECAGHPGEDDVPTMVLVPAAVDALSIPVLAAGGVADGRGLAAALMLGAEGVTMGTRFFCTQEAGVHDSIKQAMVAATERDTRLIFRPLRNTARVLANRISEEVVALEHRPGGAAFDELRHLVAGARGKAALETGEVDGGVLWAGQSVGLVRDIPTCQELIDGMVTQCRAQLCRGHLLV